MGYALAEAALANRHDVVLITGPVSLSPPDGAIVHRIETTAELQSACLEAWPGCDGVIATAAVCDYRPRERFSGKIAKSGTALNLELVETADVLAELGRSKGARWILGFALESSEYAHQHALKKIREKNCDAIVLNRPSAISAETNQVELLGSDGTSLAGFAGTKRFVAEQIWNWVESQFSDRPPQAPIKRLQRWKTVAEAMRAVCNDPDHFLPTPTIISLAAFLKGFEQGHREGSISGQEASTDDFGGPEFCKWFARQFPQTQDEGLQGAWWKLMETAAIHDLALLPKLYDDFITAKHRF